MEAARQSVADCHDGGAGGVHGGARHLHCQRGPAAHRGQPRRQHRPGHVGADQLPGLERDRAAARRLGLEPDGSPQLLRLLHHGLHDRQFSLRRCAIAAHASAVPRDSGRGRRRHAAHGAGHHGRLVRAPQARAGLRTLRPRRGARAIDRAHAGRLDHRQLLLALDLLHQHSGRHSRVHPGHAPGRRSAVDQGRPLQAAQHGLRGPGVPHHRHGRHADHARQGRGERLVRFRLHSLLRDVCLSAA